MSRSHGPPLTDEERSPRRGQPHCAHSRIVGGGVDEGREHSAAADTSDSELNGVLE